MLRYLTRRVAISFLTLFLVTTISFLLIHTMPGNPFATKELLGLDMQGRLMSYYGLDKPIIIQYKTYMINLLQGNLGYSYRTPGLSVNEIIEASFPVSIQLGLMAYLPSVLLGAVLGAVSVAYENKMADKVIIAFSAINVAVPVFVVASLLQFFFSVKLHLFPAARWGNINQAILPVLSLMIGGSMVKARFIRSLLMEIVNEPYMCAIKANGLSRSQLIFRHGIRNIMPPVLSSMGTEMATVITGSFVIEQVYAIPGMGTAFANALHSLDYSVVLGLVIFYTFFVVSFNLIIDLIYGLVDPRIHIVDKVG